MYIGLNDRQTEGKYVWEHNKELAGNYSPWTDYELGQPASLREKEDCVVVKQSGTWHDVPCAWSYPFMCEYP